MTFFTFLKEWEIGDITFKHLQILNIANKHQQLIHFALFKFLAEKKSKFRISGSLNDSAHFHTSIFSTFFCFADTLKFVS